MKFALAYYLLLIYSTVILKPLIPVIEDGLSHCFAEAYHIATVHAKYGNNHLENEIAGTSDNTDNSSNKNTLKEDDAVSVHVVSIEENCCFEIANTILSYIIQPKSPLCKIVLSKTVPPPKNFLTALLNFS